jgi:hypothetical protein
MFVVNAKTLKRKVFRLYVLSNSVKDLCGKTLLMSSRDELGFRLSRLTWEITLTMQADPFHADRKTL